MRRRSGQRDFRRLLLGQSASTIGDRLVSVALAVYVTDLRHAEGRADRRPPAPAVPDAHRAGASRSPR